MSLEQDAARALRKTKLRTAILTAVEVAGMLSIALIAPNVLSALGKTKRWSSTNCKSALYRLRDRGLVTIHRGMVAITPRGSSYLDSSSFRPIRPRKWDKKWRVVIFDIAEHRRNARNQLRRSLEQIGFIKLQQSVWVFPFACEDLIALLKIDQQLGKHVCYMIVDKIENDRKLRMMFGLPFE